VKDPAMRAKLRAVSYNQPQVTDASHYIVFASKINLSEKDLDAYIHRTAEVRGVTVESLAGFRASLVGSLIQGKDVAARDAWCKNQTYIALGFVLTAAAALGIDANPMEGIDRAQYDSILGLTQKNLSSCMVAGFGYRSPNDQYSKLPKVRFPKEKVFIEV
jgi:nitroreductase